jgi:hypothetical protein
VAGIASITGCGISAAPALFMWMRPPSAAAVSLRQGAGSKVMGMGTGGVGSKTWTA